LKAEPESWPEGASRKVDGKAEPEDWAKAQAGGQSEGRARRSAGDASRRSFGRRSRKVFPRRESKVDWKGWVRRLGEGASWRLIGWPAKESDSR